MSRGSSTKDQKEYLDHHAVTYGDYFLAVSQFLEKDGFAALIDGISKQIDHSVDKNDFTTVEIYLEKHGEFYHPARLETIVYDQIIRFVVNAAFSKMGNLVIKREFEILKRLNQHYPDSYIPDVYSSGDVDLPGDGRKTRMFLGRWFKDYHEFHQTLDPGDNTKKIAVWDPETGSYYLTENQTIELYVQTAKILTGYYNMETYEQIFPWHHAAGDFVIRKEKNSIDIKLITVRNYGPVSENRGNDAASILNELLIFFINLSIWTRIDRIDGVGGIAWSGDSSVEGTIRGFFKGLDTQPLIRCFDMSVRDSFTKYLSFWSESEILDLAENIIALYHPQSPEIPIIKKNIKAHIQNVFSILNKSDDE